MFSFYQSTGNRTNDILQLQHVKKDVHIDLKAMVFVHPSVLNVLENIRFAGIFGNNKQGKRRKMSKLLGR